MPLRVSLNILNQKGTPAFYSDIFANRPAFGYAGRVFISTDTGAIYEDTGSAWTLIADAGAGTTGTLQQVTTNGNTTTQGLVVTAGNVAIGTATAGAPLDIHTTTGTAAQFNGTGTNNSYLFFQNAGASKWRIGNLYNAGANEFNIYNIGLTKNALSFNSTTNEATFNANTTVLGSFYATEQGTGNGSYFSAYSNNVTDDHQVTINRYRGTIAIPLTLLSGDNIGGVAFGGYNGTTAIESARIQAYAGQNFSSSQSGTYLSVAVTPYGTNSDVYKFRFDNSGGFYINGDADVTSGYKLQVNGGVYITGSTNYFANKILLGSTTDDTVNILQVTGSAITTGNFETKTKLILQTSSSPTAPGQMGYGSDAGLFIWPKAGTTYCYTLYSNTGNESIRIPTGTTTINLPSLAGTGSRAVLADASGSLSAPVSDISVKQNIKSIGYGLNEILKMNPVWFDYIDEYKNYGEARQNGNIAQEMKKIIPEAVFITPSTGKMGINYDQLHAVYIKAIQELNEKLTCKNIN